MPVKTRYGYMIERNPLFVYSWMLKKDKVSVFAENVWNGWCFLPFAKLYVFLGYDGSSLRIEDHPF